jgi:hypothetical protein
LKLVLTQRLGVLETLNGVYMKIEQASTDVEVRFSWGRNPRVYRRVRERETDEGWE